MNRVELLVQGCYLLHHAEERVVAPDAITGMMLAEAVAMKRRA
jgi:hypothetical protein